MLEHSERPKCLIFPALREGLGRVETKAKLAGHLLDQFSHGTDCFLDRCVLRDSIVRASYISNLPDAGYERGEDYRKRDVLTDAGKTDQWSQRRGFLSFSRRTLSRSMRRCVYPGLLRMRTWWRGIFRCVFQCV